MDSRRTESPFVAPIAVTNGLSMPNGAACGSPARRAAANSLCPLLTPDGAARLSAERSGARAGGTRGAAAPRDGRSPGVLRAQQVARSGSGRAPGEASFVASWGQGAWAQAAAHEDRRRGGGLCDLRAGRSEALLFPAVGDPYHQQAG